MIWSFQWLEWIVWEDAGVEGLDLGVSDFVVLRFLGLPEVIEASQEVGDGAKGWKKERNITTCDQENRVQPTANVTVTATAFKLFSRKYQYLISMHSKNQ